MDTSAGSTSPLTSPNENTYYMHQGKLTSAQYYVNPAGVSVQDACRWTSGADQGNKAPVNLGVGSINGVGWLSIIPNHPTSYATLDFDIEIVGDNLGGGKCKYHKGTYYDANGGNTVGCTVSII